MDDLEELGRLAAEQTRRRPNPGRGYSSAAQAARVRAINTAIVTAVLVLVAVGVLGLIVYLVVQVSGEGAAHKAEEQKQAEALRQAGEAQAAAQKLQAVRAAITIDAVTLTDSRLELTAHNISRQAVKGLKVEATTSDHHAYQIDFGDIPVGGSEMRVADVPGQSVFDATGTQVQVIGGEVQ